MINCWLHSLLVLDNNPVLDDDTPTLMANFKTAFDKLFHRIFHPTSTNISTSIDWQEKQYQCPNFKENALKIHYKYLQTSIQCPKSNKDAVRYQMKMTKKEKQNHANLKIILEKLMHIKYFEIEFEPKSTSTSASVDPGVYVLFGKYILGGR